MLCFKKHRLNCAIGSLFHRVKLGKLEWEKGKQVDNGSSLFTTVRADGWKNKYLGLFNVLTLMETKRKKENLHLQTAKQRTVSQQHGFFFPKDNKNRNPSTSWNDQRSSRALPCQKKRLTKLNGLNPKSDLFYQCWKLQICIIYNRGHTTPLLFSSFYFFRNFPTSSAFQTPQSETCQWVYLISWFITADCKGSPAAQHRPGCCVQTCTWWSFHTSMATPRVARMLVLKHKHGSPVWKWRQVPGFTGEF